MSEQLDPKVVPVNYTKGPNYVEDSQAEIDCDLYDLTQQLKERHGLE